jgi:hypothetical protein
LASGCAGDRGPAFARLTGFREDPASLLGGGRRREAAMIRQLSSGKYRLYSRKLDPKTGKRRNLGTFGSRQAAEQHEREVQYFKRH